MGPPTECRVRWFVDEYGAAALGMAGGSPRRQGTRVLQVQNGFHDKPGREDGIRRDQALRGVNHFDTGAWWQPCWLR